jgi:glycosyltransferase involved in cell wall biosynthesis
MAMMLVSVVVPTANRLSLLSETVRSVQNQTHAHWELLIVDDGSSDGTKKWCISQQEHDPRIRLIERAKHRVDAHGAQVCRNLGLQMAQGEVVLFLDSDDLLAPDCLHRRLIRLDADPSIDAVVGQALRFRHNPGDLGSDNIWGHWLPGQDDLDRFLAHGILWQTSGPLWRRRALDRVGPWDETLQHVGHDHEFHVRALCRGVRMHKLLGVDYYWRVPRKDSLSSLESFKIRFGDGGMISAYRSIMAVVMASGVLTPHRQRLIRAEVIRLAMNCRNFGGSPSLAERGLLDAYGYGLIGPLKISICRLLLRCWWRIGGRLPAMALLNRLAKQAEPAT